MKSCLDHKSSAVVKRAAILVFEHKLESLLEEVRESFERFLKLGPGADKGCEAKTALMKAMCELEFREEDLYLRATTLVQKEFAYGAPPDDVAAELRGLAGIGLVRNYFADVLEVLADLLSDPEARTRSLAAQAILEHGHQAGAALLRLKLRTGEKDSEVLLDCLLGLLLLSPNRGLDFTRDYLDTLEGSHWEAALLALGQSRSLPALEFLISRYPEQVRPYQKRALLEAVALNRSEEALAFLREQAQSEESSATELLKSYWGELFDQHQ